VFLGTSAFAADVLDELAELGHGPALVLTRPDRPRGRGRRLASPPVAERARERGLPLGQPVDINAPDALEEILAASPAAICICAFGALIREPLLSARPMLNVHPSLLPRWRGAAPLERAIMAGDERTGVSIMQVTAGLDSGPVGPVEEVAIGPRDTYGTLAAGLAPIGARLLVRALVEEPAYAEQDESLATYAEKIGPADRRLDPRQDASVLERVIRALEPHVGARLEDRPGAGLRVHSARVVADQDWPGLPSPVAGALEARDARLLLGCGEGVLELLSVQPAGGREMSGAEYARGHATALG